MATEHDAEHEKTGEIADRATARGGREQTVERAATEPDTARDNATEPDDTSPDPTSPETPPHKDGFDPHATARGG